MIFILSSAILWKWIKWNHYTSPVLMRYTINFILKKNATICFLLLKTTIYSKYHIYAQFNCFEIYLLWSFMYFALFLNFISLFWFPSFCQMLILYMLSNFEVIGFQFLNGSKCWPKIVQLLILDFDLRTSSKIGWLCEHNLESIFIVRKCEKNTLYVCLYWTNN